MSAFALLEENLHALCHIDAQEHVRIAEDGRESCQKRGFEDRVLAEVSLPESLSSEVPLHNESAVQSAEDADDDVEDDLEEVPASVVLYREHD